MHILRRAQPGMRTRLRYGNRWKEKSGSVGCSTYGRQDGHHFVQRQKLELLCHRLLEGVVEGDDQREDRGRLRALRAEPRQRQDHRLMRCRLDHCGEQRDVFTQLQALPEQHQAVHRQDLRRKQICHLIENLYLLYRMLCILFRNIHEAIDLRLIASSLY